MRGSKPVADPVITPVSTNLNVRRFPRDCTTDCKALIASTEVCAYREGVSSYHCTVCRCKHLYGISSILSRDLQHEGIPCPLGLKKLRRKRDT